MAQTIHGARFVELAGADHLPFLGDQDAILDEVEEFLPGARYALETDRGLAAVLFTDIVGSTELAARLGDRRWSELLVDTQAVVRRELDRFWGREVDAAGDGLMASFDGPARAIRCARAIAEGVRAQGIEVRAGVHTGECRVMGERLAGIAVHLASRICGLAEPGEVLTSGTVRDLVAGSGIRFEDRGLHQSKGVPEPGACTGWSPERPWKYGGAVGLRWGSARGARRLESEIRPLPVVWVDEVRAGPKG